MTKRRLLACLLAAFVAGMLAAALLLSADTGPQPWPVERTSVPFEPPVLATPHWEVRG